MSDQNIPSTTWRDFAEQLTEQTRKLFESAEERGESPEFLLDSVIECAEDESFTLACDGIAQDSGIDFQTASRWLPPDQDHAESYRELTTCSRTVLAIAGNRFEIEVSVDVSLSGDALRTAVMLWANDGGGTLTPVEARLIATELVAAADAADQLIRRGGKGADEAHD